MSADLQQRLARLPYEEGMRASDIIAHLAPLLNNEIELFEAQGGKGAEAFGKMIIDHLKAVRLCSRVRMDVESIAVHPDNREKHMLLPIDVHDLLKELVTRGWNEDKCHILASGLPGGCLGEHWLKKNDQLVQASDGLIASYNPNLVKAFTGRGSHTSAALRCAKFSTVGVHAELCGENGRISRGRVVELQPSLAAPLDNGVNVDLIDPNLFAACPKLMATLSRVDNDHGVGRVQTTLQNCTRIYNILHASPDVPDERIIQLACIGLTSDAHADAGRLLHFVRAWSGGKDKSILQDLEDYEKTLKVKRNISPEDLKAFAKVEPTELEIFAPAMIKAMLNAPIDYCDTRMYSTLFTSKGSDLSSIAEGGRNRTFAVSANKMMLAARKFFMAYGSRIAKTDQLKLLSSMEIRCVMHVFQKRAASRTNYHSIQIIATEMYDESKLLDKLLPVWSKLESIKKASAPEPGAAKPIGGLREIRADGTVTNEELLHRGFEIGKQIIRCANDDEEDEDTVYNIVSFDTALLNVELKEKKETDDEDNDPEPIFVSRFELIKKYKLKQLAHDEATQIVHAQLRFEMFIFCSERVLQFSVSEFPWAHFRLFSIQNHARPMRWETCPT